MSFQHLMNAAQRLKNIFDTGNAKMPNDYQVQNHIEEPQRYSLHPVTKSFVITVIVFVLYEKVRDFIVNFLVSRSYENPEIYYNQLESIATQASYWHSKPSVQQILRKRFEFNFDCLLRCENGDYFTKLYKFLATNTRDVCFVDEYEYQNKGMETTTFPNLGKKIDQLIAKHLLVTNKTKKALIIEITKENLFNAIFHHNSGFIVKLASLLDQNSISIKEVFPSGLLFSWPFVLGYFIQLPNLNSKEQIHFISDVQTISKFEHYFPLTSFYPKHFFLILGEKGIKMSNSTPQKKYRWNSLDEGLGLRSTIVLPDIINEGLGLRFIINEGLGLRSTIGLPDIINEDLDSPQSLFYIYRKLKVSSITKSALKNLVKWFIDNENNENNENNNNTPNDILNIPNFLLHPYHFVDKSEYTTMGFYYYPYHYRQRDIFHCSVRNPSVIFIKNSQGNKMDLEKVGSMIDALPTFTLSELKALGIADQSILGLLVE